MKKMICFSLAACLFASCKKDNVDNTDPVITINSPIAGQAYTAGQTVSITGTVTDDDELHAVHVYVNNKANNAEIIHQEDHVDKQTYVLNKSFTAQAGVTYTIKIEADDHSSNQSEVKMEIAVK